MAASAPRRNEVERRRFNTRIGPKLLYSLPSCQETCMIALHSPENSRAFLDEAYGGSISLPPRGRCPPEGRPVRSLWTAFYTHLFNSTTYMRRAVALGLFVEVARYGGQSVDHDRRCALTVIALTGEPSLMPRGVRPKVQRTRNEPGRSKHLPLPVPERGSAGTVWVRKDRIPPRR